MSSTISFDEIGYWSEVKLDIIKEYAAAYSRILDKQPRLYHIYIDAFSGAGINISKTTREFVLGSPLNALEVKPSFREFHLIDLDGTKISTLQRLVGTRPDVHLYHGDANDVLLEDIFPKVQYKDFRRGLCLLDPYGLQLDWKVIRTAGKMETIDIFLNFPIMDMNRNAIWRNPEAVSEAGIKRLNAFWGDESWREIAYRPISGLFDTEMRKASNPEIAGAFATRLQKVAGFKEVPEPLPMRNRNRSVVYYLFFASHKPVAHGIVRDIFDKYRKRGIR